jgi:hypothetical protein
VRPSKISSGNEPSAPEINETALMTAGTPRALSGVTDTFASVGAESRSVGNVLASNPFV